MWAVPGMLPGSPQSKTSHPAIMAASSTVRLSHQIFFIAWTSVQPQLALTARKRCPFHSSVLNLDRQSLPVAHDIKPHVLISSTTRHMAITSRAIRARMHTTHCSYLGNVQFFEAPF